MWYSEGESMNKYFAELNRKMIGYNAKCYELRKRKEACTQNGDWDGVMKCIDEEEKLEVPITNGEWKALEMVAYSEGKEYVLSNFLYENEVEDFCESLKKSGVESFIFTNHSTALIENIHDFINNGLEFAGVVDVEKKRGRHTDIVKGLRFSVKGR